MYPKSFCVLILTLLLTACSANPAARTSDAGPGWVNFVSSQAGFRLRLPAEWEGRYRAQTLKGGTREAPLALWEVRFFHLPEEQGVEPGRILTLAIYDRASWDTMRFQRGRFANEVATFADRVWVATLPEGNPYTEGSEDARRFDAMRPTMEQLRENLFPSP